MSEGLYNFLMIIFAGGAVYGAIRADIKYLMRENREIKASIRNLGDIVMKEIVRVQNEKR